MAICPFAAEDGEAAEPEPELELQPARSATPARPVAADTPKRLRSTIGPPVSSPSDCAERLRAPLERASARSCAWKIDRMYGPCQRLSDTKMQTVTETIYSS